MRDHKESRFTKVIGITEEDYEFVVINKGKKSRAGFLEYVIKCFKDTPKDELKKMAQGGDIVAIELLKKK